MSEVNSCCCLSLRQGCVLIGGVTILVSVVQTLIFSWVLVETYQSYQFSLNYQQTSSIDSNSSMGESSSSTYSFDSSRCPVGFLPLSTKLTNNESTEEEEEEEYTQEDEATDTNLTQNVVFSMATSTTTTSSNNSNSSSTQAVPLAIELTFEEEVNPTSSSSSALLSSPDEDGLLLPSSSSSSSSSSINDTYEMSSLSSSSSSSSINDSFILVAVSSSSSSVSASSSSQPLIANSSSSRTLNKSKMQRIKCAAPGQGLLWALVVVSALYTLVGIVLIFAILYCVSWQLSIWFFYTVGYNLFMLIVAMTDGNYTSLSDISSYVVCVITAYCVRVVDSYYEKQLLVDERTDKNGPSRRRSSLVIVRSSPDSPTSQQDYIPPTTYRVPTNHNTLAPPPAHNLAPPPNANFALPMNMAPPPAARPPAYHASAERNRENPHHAYHNNL